MLSENFKEKVLTYYEVMIIDGESHESVVFEILQMVKYDVRAEVKKLLEDSTKDYRARY